MEQQTLLRPPQQAPQGGHLRTAQAQAQVQAKGPVSHRKPQSRSTRGDRLWAVASLVVMFVLSLLAGVLLAVHGPSSDSSSLEVRPAPTPVPAPQMPHGPVIPRPVPVKETPKKPTGTAVEKVALRPGDTLYALAGAHGTSVKVLQELNDLGSSTLIYADETLRVPATGSTEPQKIDLPDTDPPKSDPPKSDPPKPDPPKKKPGEAPKSGAKAVVAFARAQLGKPYVWGGTGPRGYDCSGLVMRAWEKAGVELPRTTWDQVRAGKATTRAELIPGDLIISNNGGHVQLYIGDGRVIHAPGRGKNITTAPLPAPSGVDSYRHITP
ncbi:LysM peptidoglycan-binding domain-containing C40 family peptidase [Streptomyces sp. NPDC006645]|uniref:C40 family peptidase n=1 Tax=unclassified Streptomyces TaxID=2593676 RepID=UPI0033A14FC3